MTGDAALAIYNDRIKALSAQVLEPRRLPCPAATARARSAVCGSEVSIDLAYDDAGRIAAIGYEADACSLTRAVLAVLVFAACGKTPQAIEEVRAAFVAMLQDGAPPPGGDWAELALFAHLQAFPARHDSALLPFAALQKAAQARVLDA